MLGVRGGTGNSPAGFRNRTLPYSTTPEASLRASHLDLTPFPIPLLKSMERRWRALWIRTIVALVRSKHGRQQPRPDWSAGSHRVLFLRHDRLGDMILTTAALRAIAESHPGLRLDVLASPANAPVIAGSGHIGSVVLFDKKTPWTWPAVAWRLRRARYDAVVDCMVTAPSLTTLLLMLASGARHRIAAAGREGRAGTDDVITIAVPTPPSASHMTERLGALAGAFGVDVEHTNWRPELDLSPEELGQADAAWARAAGDAPRFLVNVSAGIVQRRWPEDRYVAVLRHLRARAPRARLVVIGAPDEADRAQRIARGGDALYVATAGVREAFALVAVADFVFTPDTSIAHAASAFEKPAVAMYLPGNAERWGLYHARGRNLESSGPTLDSLGVDAVTSAIDEVLGN